MDIFIQSVLNNSFSCGADFIPAMHKGGFVQAARQE